VHLKIFYSKTNDAWAIAPNVGSLEVLAYVHGNVLSPEFDSANAGEMTWVIANENGEYEIDPDVIVSGALLEGADESDGTQTDDDDGDGVSGSMSTVAEASDVFAVSLGSWHPQTQRVTSVAVHYHFFLPLTLTWPLLFDCTFRRKRTTRNTAADFRLAAPL